MLCQPLETDFRATTFLFLPDFVTFYRSHAKKIILTTANDFSDESLNLPTNLPTLQILYDSLVQLPLAQVL